MHPKTGLGRPSKGDCMHRSNFRVRRKLGTLERARPVAQEAAKAAKSDELAELREQIENVAKTLSPLTANVERLAAPKEDISVPADIGKAIQLAHNRLDRLEAQQKEALSELRRMATTFSNALLRMGDKVEKIAGGEDSSFSLAHSLEKLISVLSSRKMRVVRDSDGNMVELEMKV